ncbi:MAG: hypothetical protein N3A38_12135 [Planctomycetota bacterium]|nr:hypothetical protein [Planctomycetota bacterium]
MATLAGRAGGGGAGWGLAALPAVAATGGLGGDDAATPAAGGLPTPAFRAGSVRFSPSSEYPC